MNIVHFYSLLWFVGFIWTLQVNLERRRGERSASVIRSRGPTLPCCPMHAFFCHIGRGPTWGAILQLGSDELHFRLIFLSGYKFKWFVEHFRVYSSSGVDGGMESRGGSVATCSHSVECRHWPAQLYILTSSAERIPVTSTYFTSGKSYFCTLQRSRGEAHACRSWVLSSQTYWKAKYKEILVRHRVIEDT